MSNTNFLLLSLAAIVLNGRLVRAQTDADESRINSSLGGGLSAPLNPTARLAGVSGNAVAGVGYNINRRNSLIGEFMWSGLRPNRDAFLPIRIVERPREVSGSSNLFAVTGNYRFMWHGEVFGGYVIVGGGVYYRRSKLSREVIVGRGTVCGPSWNWWGYTCESGLVSEDELP